jgi:hypothetical protein
MCARRASGVGFLTVCWRSQETPTCTVRHRRRLSSRRPRRRRLLWSCRHCRRSRRSRCSPPPARGGRGTWSSASTCLTSTRPRSCLPKATQSSLSVSAEQAVRAAFCARVRAAAPDALLCCLADALTPLCPFHSGRQQVEPHGPFARTPRAARVRDRRARRRTAGKRAAVPTHSPSHPTAGAGVLRRSVAARARLDPHGQVSATRPTCLLCEAPHRVSLQTNAKHERGRRHGGAARQGLPDADCRRDG